MTEGRFPNPEGLHQHPRHGERTAGDHRDSDPGKANIEDDLAGNSAVPVRLRT